jgi:hypothetical protein
VVRTYDRAFAAALTGQWRLGAIPGVAAQTLLACGLIFYSISSVGLACSISPATLQT